MEVMLVFLLATTAFAGADFALPFPYSSTMPSLSTARGDIDETHRVRRLRSLTTICVEIRPNTPKEKSYFMCKGAELPTFPNESGGSYGDVQPQPQRQYNNIQQQPQQHYAENNRPNYPTSNKAGVGTRTQTRPLENNSPQFQSPASTYETPKFFESSADGTRNFAIHQPSTAENYAQQTFRDPHQQKPFQSSQGVERQQIFQNQDAFQSSQSIHQQQQKIYEPGELFAGQKDAFQAYPAAPATTSGPQTVPHQQEGSFFEFEKRRFDFEAPPLTEPVANFETPFSKSANVATHAPIYSSNIPRSQPFHSNAYEAPAELIANNNDGYGYDAGDQLSRGGGGAHANTAAYFGGQPTRSSYSESSFASTPPFALAENPTFVSTVFGTPTSFPAATAHQNANGAEVRVVQTHSFLNPSAPNESEVFTNDAVGISRKQQPKTGATRFRASIDEDVFEIPDWGVYEDELAHLIPRKSTDEGFSMVKEQQLPFELESYLQQQQSSRTMPLEYMDDPVMRAFYESLEGYKPVLLPASSSAGRHTHVPRHQQCASQQPLAEPIYRPPPASYVSFSSHNNYCDGCQNHEREYTVQHVILALPCFTGATFPSASIVSNLGDIPLISAPISATVPIYARSYQNQGGQQIRTIYPLGTSAFSTHDLSTTNTNANAEMSNASTSSLMHLSSPQFQSKSLRAMGKLINRGLAAESAKENLNNNSPEEAENAHNDVTVASEQMPSRSTGNNNTFSSESSLGDSSSSSSTEAMPNETERTFQALLDAAKALSDDVTPSDDSTTVDADMGDQNMKKRHSPKSIVGGQKRKYLQKL